MLEESNFDFILAIYSIISTSLFMFTYRKRSDMKYWLIGIIFFSIGNVAYFLKHIYNIFNIIRFIFYVLVYITLYSAIIKQHYELFIIDKKSVKFLSYFKYYLIILIFLVILAFIFIYIPLILIGSISVLLLIHIYSKQKSITNILKTLIMFTGTLAIFLDFINVYLIIGEEYALGIYIVMVTIVLMMAITGPLEHKIMNSEKRYYNAYNRAELYKDIFVHDINNILQSLLTSIDIFQVYHLDHKKTSEIFNTITIAREQIQRGATLSSAVKRLSEIEREKIQLKATNLYKLLMNSLEWIKKFYESDQINIHINSDDKEIKVLANDLLFDLFNCVIENAVKHNIQDIKEIWINISRVKVKQNNFILIELIDNGKGIPDIMKRSLLEPLNEKVEKLTRLGLGLSLVKEVIKIFNGEIQVKDRISGEPTKGTNFQILIHETF